MSTSPAECEQIIAERVKRCLVWWAEACRDTLAPTRSRSEKQAPRSWHRGPTCLRAKQNQVCVRWLLIDGRQGWGGNLFGGGASVVHNWQCICFCLRDVEFRAESPYRFLYYSNWTGRKSARSLLLWISLTDPRTLTIIEPHASRRQPSASIASVSREQP